MLAKSRQAAFSLSDLKADFLQTTPLRTFPVGYKQAGMPDLTPLERAALRGILTESECSGVELEKLFDTPVLTRENTGGGFFVEWATSLPACGSRSLGENVWIAVEGMELGLGMILHLREGQHPLLEGYAVGPEDTSGIDFEQVHFAVVTEPQTYPPNAR